MGTGLFPFENTFNKKKKPNRLIQNITARDKTSYEDNQERILKDKFNLWWYDTPHNNLLNAYQAYNKFSDDSDYNGSYFDETIELPPNKFHERQELYIKKRIECNLFIRKNAQTLITF